MRERKLEWALSDPETHQGVIEVDSWEDCAAVIALYLFINTKPGGFGLEEIDEELIDLNPTEVFDKCKKWIDQLSSNKKNRGAK